MNQVLKNIDVYLSPSFSGPNLTNTNFTGHPAICVPNGFKEGRPTSITITGRLFGEGDVLAVAIFFQGRTGWEDRRP